jgi:hypothetical protein
VSENQVKWVLDQPIKSLPPQLPPVLLSIPLCGAAYSSPDANNRLFDD